MSRDVRTVHPHCHEQAEGREDLEDERERVPGLVAILEKNKAGLRAFNEYANRGGTEVGVVRLTVTPNRSTFDMKAIAERTARAYTETPEATTSIQLYGTPSETVLRMLSRQAGAGVPLAVKRHHVGGYTRTTTD